MNPLHHKCMIGVVIVWYGAMAVSAFVPMVILSRWFILPAAIGFALMITGAWKVHRNCSRLLDEDR